MKELYDYSLLRHNTFGIEARCRRFIELGSVDEVCQCVTSLTDADSPLFLLGGGSNVLFTSDYPGTVLHSAIKGIEPVAIEDGVLLRCGSGEMWDDVVAYSVSHGWYGAENLSAIPGEVGASAVQNIGAYGAEVKDIIYKVEAVEIATGKVCEFSRTDCRYAYRYSRFKDEWRGRYFITHVIYKLSNVFVPHLDYGNIRSELKSRGITVPTAVQIRETVKHIRSAKLPDPKDEGNAGSFFMNPVVCTGKYLSLVAEYPDMPHYTVDENHEKIPAGWLIDRCGWKGRSLGRAGVHDKQALVLVNRGGASGDDIVSLCQAVQSDVYVKFGIKLSPEVNII